MKKYLERLPQEFKGLIYSIRNLANRNNLPVYIVGGLVRDLILGVKNFDTFGGILLRQAQDTSPKDTEQRRSETPPFRAGKEYAVLSINPKQTQVFRPECRRIDLDVVVEGDGIGFAEDLAISLKSKLVRHRRFGTATVILKPGLKVDIASARKEIYPKPACLPEVTPGVLRDDLFRRDFTINTMAIKISKSEFGRLIDLFGGKDDLINRKIRVLHNLSFIDDPTRILRAIRFEKRYNFRIEAKTLRLLKEASRNKMLERVEPQRLRDELILSLKEEYPLRQIRRIQSLVGLGFICSGLSLSQSSELLFRSIAGELRWFKNAHTRRRQLDFWLIYLMAMLDHPGINAVRSGCKRFAFSRGEVKRIISYKKINRSFISKLSREKISPADIFGLLEPFSYEVILLLKAKYKDAVLQRHIKDFLEFYNGMRLHVSGDDLHKLGLKPGPGYKKIFKKVLKAKLNGLVKTREEELGLIKKLALS